MFLGELPVKMQERGSQQTGCLLFTVVQIDSVRPAFEARDPGGLFSQWRPLPPYTLPSLLLRHPVPTNMPSISSFLPEQRWRLPSANREPRQLWAHRREPMSNTCFSQAWLSMPIITPTLFGLCRVANPNT